MVVWHGYLVACRNQLVVIVISVTQARLAASEWPHPQDRMTGIRYTGVPQTQQVVEHSLTKHQVETRRLERMIFFQHLDSQDPC